MTPGLWGACGLLGTGSKGSCHFASLTKLSILSVSDLDSCDLLLLAGAWLSPINDCALTPHLCVIYIISQLSTSPLLAHVGIWKLHHQFPQDESEYRSCDVSMCWIKIPFIRPVRSFLQSSGCIYTACSEAFMEYFCTPAPWTDCKHWFWHGWAQSKHGVKHGVKQAWCWLLSSLTEDWWNELKPASRPVRSELTVTLQRLCGNLTVTPYLRAIPCRVSLSVTRCSMYFSPSEAVTLAVLPYDRILVRARLWDSSLSDSEPDLDRGKMGWPNRPPPSRIGRTGENSAIFSWINKAPCRRCVS